MHIGDPGYFSELSALLADLAAGGAEVQFEGITDRPGERMTEWERARLTEAAAWPDPETSGAAARLLRLESQGRLQLPEGARNIDLSHVELLRKVGWHNYRRILAVPPPAEMLDTPSPLVRAAICFQLKHTRGLDRLRLLRRRNRRVDRVVVTERTRIAFAGAREALAHGDVVLVWGAGHLPGLAARFRSVGYVLNGEEWFTACTI
jgi:hypothetical protein